MKERIAHIVQIHQDFKQKSQQEINLQSSKHLPSLKALLCNVVLTELGCSKHYKDNRELTRTLRRLGE